VFTPVDPVMNEILVTVIPESSGMRATPILLPPAVAMVDESAAHLGIVEERAPEGRMLEKSGTPVGKDGEGY
jgi:hypothetical protein